MYKEIDIQVRFNDLDGYSHVNNSVYLSYMEVARTKCYADIFNDSIESGIWFLLVSAEVQYKRFIKLDDRVIVKLHISQAKGATFSFEYEIHNGDGIVFATGKTTHAVFDSKKQKPMRIPENIKALAVL